MELEICHSFMELATGESLIAHEEAFAAIEHRFPRVILKRELYIGHIKGGVDGTTTTDGKNGEAGDVWVALPLERINEGCTIPRFRELNSGISDHDIYRSIIAHEYGHLVYARHEPAVDLALMGFPTQEHKFLWYALNEGFASTFAETVLPFKYSPAPPVDERFHGLYIKNLSVLDKVRSVGIDAITADVLLGIAREEALDLDVSVLQQREEEQKRALIKFFEKVA